MNRRIRARWKKGMRTSHSLANLPPYLFDPRALLARHTALYRVVAHGAVVHPAVHCREDRAFPLRVDERSAFGGLLLGCVRLWRDGSLVYIYSS